MTQEEIQQRIAALEAAMDLVDNLRWGLDSVRVPEYPETHPFGWRSRPEWFILFHVTERYGAELQYLYSLVDDGAISQNNNTVAWALQEYGW